jgi:hypothetical protein
MIVETNFEYADFDDFDDFDFDDFEYAKFEYAETMMFFIAKGSPNWLRPSYKAHMPSNSSLSQHKSLT